ncbi:hypothetical protein BH24ACI1_BH24ACI1_02370 [soil metagenome]|jgi:hypothetical protein
MLRLKSPNLLAFVFLSLVLLGGGCYSNESNSRWANAQRESTQGVNPTATSESKQSQTASNRPPRSNKPLAGGEFNKFFPAASDGYTRVASQEKEGFAEYKLKKDGKDVAMLAVTDTVTNPEAAAKFRESTRQINGYPAIDQGSTATAVLVDNRFQVKVLSRNPSFTKEDREAWLQKFDFAGIAGL